MNPPVAVHPPPAGLDTVQARRRELHVEESTSARDSLVRAATHVPMLRAQPGPWPGGYEEGAPLPETDQKQARQLPMKVTVQNLFLELSTTSNTEPFGCHHAGD